MSRWISCPAGRVGRDTTHSSRCVGCLRHWFRRQEPSYRGAESICCCQGRGWSHSNQESGIGRPCNKTSRSPQEAPRRRPFRRPGPQVTQRQGPQADHERSGQKGCPTIGFKAVISSQNLIYTNIYTNRSLIFTFLTSSLPSPSSPPPPTTSPH